MIYRVTFFGRKVGAIGICYWIAETVKADSDENALRALYTAYDHISGFRIRERLLDE